MVRILQLLRVRKALTRKFSEPLNVTVQMFTSIILQELRTRHLRPRILRHCAVRGMTMRMQSLMIGLRNPRFTRRRLYRPLWKVSRILRPLMSQIAYFHLECPPPVASVKHVSASQEYSTSQKSNPSVKEEQPSAGRNRTYLHIRSPSLLFLCLYFRLCSAPAAFLLPFSRLRLRNLTRHSLHLGLLFVLLRHAQDQCSCRILIGVSGVNFLSVQ